MCLHYLSVVILHHLTTSWNCIQERLPSSCTRSVVYLAYKSEIFVTTTTNLNQISLLWFDVTFVTHEGYSRRHEDIRWFFLDFDSLMVSMNILAIAWNVVVYAISWLKPGKEVCSCSGSIIWTIKNTQSHWYSRCLLFISSLRSSVISARRFRPCDVWACLDEASSLARILTNLDYIKKLEKTPN